MIPVFEHKGAHCTYEGQETTIYLCEGGFGRMCRGQRVSVSTSFLQVGQVLNFRH